MIINHEEADLRESLTSIEGGRRTKYNYGTSPLLISSIIGIAIVFICASYLIAKIQSAELAAAERNQGILKGIAAAEQHQIEKIDRLEKEFKVMKLQYEDDVRANLRACGAKR